MAHKCNFRTPWNGMNFIWNIDGKVGTQVTEQNDPDDVLLSKFLFDIIISAGGGASASPGCKVKPILNGNMDQSLGFWIYFSQVENLIGKSTVDGYISPLRGYPSKSLSICRMNTGAYNANRNVWENLPNHPLCSQSLKLKLLGPSRSV